MKKLSVIFLAVVMSVMMVVPAFAYDYQVIDAPEVESIDPSDLVDYPYWFICQCSYNSNGYTLLLTETPLYVGEDGAMYSSAVFNFKYYFAEKNGGEWKYPKTGTTTVGGKVQVNPALVSNYDVYDYNGNLFLKKWVKPVKPLAVTVIENAGSTINSETLPALSSAMTVLCITGVGLLAMLVLLKLFGKRSLIHR